MVEIGGRPILWHIMKIYMHYGFNEFVLCLGYKGAMIKEFFHNEVFREKPEDSTGLVNGGFLVFNRRIFNYLTEDDNCDLEIGPMETICHQGQLMVYKHRGVWFCMDTLRDVEYLNNLWDSGKAGWKVW